MRVIAGTCRGKKLSVPLGVITRPTSDRVKEALFSILSSRIDFADIALLDICAGTGSLGIEALSRGAGLCCFIERDRAVKAVLEKNILSVFCHGRTRILNMDAVKALNVVAGSGQCYDLALFDPPYSSGLYTNILGTLGTGVLLVPDAIVVAECSARDPLPESYGHLKRFDRRVYGETALEFFTLENK